MASDFRLSKIGGVHCFKAGSSISGARGPRAPRRHAPRGAAPRRATGASGAESLAVGRPVASLGGAGARGPQAQAGQVTVIGEGRFGGKRPPAQTSMDGVRKSIFVAKQQPTFFPPRIFSHIIKRFSFLRGSAYTSSLRRGHFHLRFKSETRTRIHEKTGEL